MQNIEIEIDDSQHWLSKTQKTKIRNMLKAGKTKEEILENIHYQNTFEKYHDFTKSTISDYKIKITFSRLSEKECKRRELSSRLRAKQHEQKSARLRHCEEDAAWKMYHRIMNHAGIKHVPQDQIRKMIPTPDDVKKNAELYRTLNEKNPNPMIKKYIHLCLS